MPSSSRPRSPKSCGRARRISILPDFPSICRSSTVPGDRLLIVTRPSLHNSLNRNRFKDKIMQQFKVLQRPLRV
ncbi:hypothetical protein E0H35_26040 [Rhizobium leguminosarum bv. viciae]|uniref:Uncharacterized protein n=1 Tax=Rhizobium leguminosarum bv. viciae TaxID=387 RepID=A0A8G2IVU2_RHILV|nr:hypothetical protein [Rhizobium leguminosarum]NKK04892.1 hypothetical protein [Rhizobium leguminosarum bv. viciae]NEH68375.1 hypothetical protein [Rhizobium leguminosarum]NEK41852.1 hypothetical protein [Rhizobium leguminosarum]NKK22727.1 hypothetical protein [Rhizobium leguminosarum bv. viciae]